MARQARVCLLTNIPRAAPASPHAVGFADAGLIRDKIVLYLDFAADSNMINNGAAGSAPHRAAKKGADPMTITPEQDDTFTKCRLCSKDIAADDMDIARDALVSNWRHIPFCSDECRKRMLQMSIDTMEKNVTAARREIKSLHIALNNFPSSKS